MRAALSRKEDDQAVGLERARAIGLFRYMLIREAADPSLTGRQRGAMVRAVAAVPHERASRRRGSAPLTGAASLDELSAGGEGAGVC
jgi:hypothetical protein